MSDAEVRGRDKLDLDSVTLMTLIIAVWESINLRTSGLVQASTIWDRFSTLQSGFEPPKSPWRGRCAISMEPNEDTVKIAILIVLRIRLKPQL